MQYSPKLKRVMAQIKEILEKEDIAGCIVLHEVGFAEFLLKVNPTYSVAKFDGKELRFKAKLKEDFNGNKKLMEYKLAATANMMTCLSDTLGMLALNMMNASEQIDAVTDAEHRKGNFLSQTDLDN